MEPASRRSFPWKLAHCAVRRGGLALAERLDGSSVNSGPLDPGEPLPALSCARPWRRRVLAPPGSLGAQKLRRPVTRLRFLTLFALGRGVCRDLKSNG